MSRFSYNRKRLEKTFNRLLDFYGTMPDTVGCMDSISKPTGHGGCGAWCCLTPETRVFTERGLIPIKDIEVGEKVWTRLGWKKVISKADKHVDEDITVVETRYGRKIRLTNDHLVFVDEFGRKSRENASDPKWVKAVDLISKKSNDKGHYIIFPKYKNNTKQSVQSIKITDYLSKYECFVEGNFCFASKIKKGKILPLSIQLNYDFCWILGLYLAEGTTGEATTEFHISSDEKEIRKKILSFAESLGLYSSYRVTHGKSLSVRVFSKVLSKLFKKIGNSGCDKKQIPQKLMKKIIKDKFLLSGLHDGYYAGDGTKKKYGNLEYSITTTSEELLYQILFFNFIENKNPVLYTQKKENRKRSYTLNINSGKYHDYVETEDDFRIPIKSVSVEKYIGDVYDIEVEDSNSFTTVAGEVHNCKIQNPQLLYCEFLYAFDYILKNWTEEELLVVIEEAIRNYLKDTPTKGCVFFDSKTKMCKIHTHRCFNCHLYGIIPDEEFTPRLERLRKEYSDINAIFKEQCKLVKAEDGEKLTMKITDKWWEKLSSIEQQLGIKANMITDKPGGTYRTYHDHLLIYLLPDYTLENLSEVRKHGKPEDKEKVIMTLMDILSKAIKGIKDDPQSEDS